MATHRSLGQIKTNGSFSKLKSYKEGICAFFGVFLRRGVDIKDFRISDGWADDVDISCTFIFKNDILGDAEIRTNGSGICIQVILENKLSDDIVIYRKSWKRLKHKGRKILRARKRPKYRKFGAYVVHGLFKHYKDFAVTSTMES
jgi:hypothetical protein